MIELFFPPIRRRSSQEYEDLRGRAGNEATFEESQLCRGWRRAAALGHCRRGRGVEAAAGVDYLASGGTLSGEELNSPSSQKCTKVYLSIW